MNTTAGNDELVDFWSSYDAMDSSAVKREEEKEDARPTTTTTDSATMTTSAAAATPVVTTMARNNGVWLDISNIMYRWTQQLLDAEAHNSQANDFHRLVAESLQRQQLDGLLSEWEVDELRYVGVLWSDLSHLVSCYTLGCTALKRKLISTLLELYTMKQINHQLFIEVCLTL